MYCSLSATFISSGAKLISKNERNTDKYNKISLEKFEDDEQMLFFRYSTFFLLKYMREILVRDSLGEVSCLFTWGGSVSSNEKKKKKKKKYFDCTLTMQISD